MIWFILGWLYLGKYCWVKLGKVLFNLCWEIVINVLKIKEDLLDLERLVNIVVLCLGIFKLIFFKLFFWVLWIEIVLFVNKLVIKIFNSKFIILLYIEILFNKNIRF